MVYPPPRYNNDGDLNESNKNNKNLNYISDNLYNNKKKEYLKYENETYNNSSSKGYPAIHEPYPTSPYSTPNNQFMAYSSHHNQDSYYNNNSYKGDQERSLYDYPDYYSNNKPMNHDINDNYYSKEPPHNLSYSHSKNYCKECINPSYNCQENPSNKEGYSVSVSPRNYTQEIKCNPIKEEIDNKPLIHDKYSSSDNSFSDSYPSYRNKEAYNMPPKYEQKSDSLSYYKIKNNCNDTQTTYNNNDHCYSPKDDYINRYDKIDNSKNTFSSMDRSINNESSSRTLILNKIKKNNNSLYNEHETIRNNTIQDKILLILK
ncbi:hypothetical protein PIROE2DRAFT_58599 [Piromyces sp. E2]|nr:hypothetical protein PIROE2DRAFT_58599 [Piromyces sp. E2]|eukprot:OUM67730.1 hypothetical protein PIROE2DRAFT_58599 [Piromyces sp. E2]